MAEYEVISEIKNMCRNNQMRDVSFLEIECEDPEQWLRSQLKGRNIELAVDRSANGDVTIHATADGLTQRYVFTLL